MPPIGPTCQPSCRSALFGRGSGAHPQEYVGRGGLARRETRVKLVLPALVTRETCVKRQSCPLRRQPRPQRHNLATFSNNPTPQPRGIARKPCPGLVRGYEPS